MKARTLSFYLDENELRDALRALDEDLLPSYSSMPHFVGLVVIRSAALSRRIVGMSIWDGDLEETEEVIARFRARLSELGALSPSTEEFEVLRLVRGQARSAEVR